MKTLTRNKRIECILDYADKQTENITAEQRESRRDFGRSFVNVYTDVHRMMRGEIPSRLVIIKKRVKNGVIRQISFSYY